jgi:hypothetical protein
MTKGHVRVIAECNSEMLPTDGVAHKEDAAAIVGIANGGV